MERREKSTPIRPPTWVKRNAFLFMLQLFPCMFTLFTSACLHLTAWQAFAVGLIFDFCVQKFKFKFDKIENKSQGQSLKTTFKRPWQEKILH